MKPTFIAAIACLAMGDLPLGVIGHEDTPMLLLTVVDGPRCMRRIGDQTWRRDHMGTVGFNWAGAGRSLCTPGGHGTLLRNAAQFR